MITNTTYTYYNMASIRFTTRGLIAPVFTPFKDDFTINYEIIPKYAQFLANSGIQGVLVNGTSGEGPSLSINERKLVTEAWVKALKGINFHIMVQVGGAPLPDVLELAKHAESLKVGSLLVLPELYFKPTKNSELINYLRKVGANAPNTSLLYYHIPGFSNVTINMGKFLNEIGDTVPTFSGIKFTSNALDEAVEASKAQNGKFAVFLGADTLMAAAYTLGLNSAIVTSLNFAPQIAVKILKAIQESRVSDARRLQNTLTEACTIITKNGTWVPTMKVAMNLLGPVNVGNARDPLFNLNLDQIDELKKNIEILKNDLF